METTDYYAEYGLAAAEIARLADKGCYRGTYGVQELKLSLLSCPPNASSTPFATVPADTFLCVAELADAQFTTSVSSFLDETGSKSIFTGPREMVIMGPGDQSVRPHACCESHYNDEVENVLFVPKHAMYPVKPMDPTNMGVLRAKTLADPLTRSLVAPNPVIVAALEDFDEDNVTNNVIQLATGPGQSNTLITRNSYAISQGRGGCAAGMECANDAVDAVVLRLRELFQNYEGVIQVEEQTFRADMCNNVVLTIQGNVNPDNYIVSGSHLDSRNTNSGAGASGAAPGADDNATGSAVHLEMARVIAENNLQFENSIQMMWFCGEEQGLLGARALARAARDNGQNIIGMFNSDMIGYTDPADPLGVVVSYMGRNSSPQLSQMCKDFSQLYLPDLNVGDTTVCCSDQQAFHENGFQAAGIFETRAGTVRYPQYHRTTDTWDNGNINMEQVYLFGMSIFAGMLEFASPL